MRGERGMEKKVYIMIFTLLRHFSRKCSAILEVAGWALARKGGATTRP